MSEKKASPDAGPLTPKKWQRGGWGWWFLVYLALVATIGLVHGIVGAYWPDSLAPMDAVLSHLTAAQSYIGLGVTRPGLGGTLGREFYANQIGVAVWGALLCSATNLILILRGVYPSVGPDVAIDRMMQRRDLNHAQATRAIDLWLFGIGLPMTAFFVLLFLNNLHGWFVFKVQSTNWLSLNFQTLLATYMTGTLFIPLTFAIVPWLVRLPRTLLSR